jgi:transposase
MTGAPTNGIIDAVKERMMSKKKSYSKQYKESACRLVTEQGYSPAQAAKSLGMPEATLNYWLHHRGPAEQRSEQHRDPTARGDAATRDPAAMAIEIQDLRDKVRRLEMEKEILKKATAFFAREQS